MIVELEEDDKSVFWMYQAALNIETVTLSDLSKMSGHIVLFGCQYDTDKLISTLRGRTRKCLDPIVILAPNIHSTIWRKLGRYPLVYHVRGWVKHEEDLIRLNLEKAKACIVLRDEIDSGFTERMRQQVSLCQCVCTCFPEICRPFHCSWH